MESAARRVRRSLATTRGGPDQCPAAASSRESEGEAEAPVSPPTEQRPRVPPASRPSAAFRHLSVTRDALRRFDGGQEE